MKDIQLKGLISENQYQVVDFIKKNRQFDTLTSDQIIHGTQLSRDVVLRALVFLCEASIIIPTYDKGNFQKWEITGMKTILI